MSTPLYDELDYDRMVNWPKRLSYELPFIEEQLSASHARRVLDVACGSGQHAIALTQRGYEVTGVDLSAAMIERARASAAAAGVAVRFIVGSFGELASQVGGTYDALLCLGNSLPHVLTDPALLTTLADFRAMLNPGGLLLVQNRNFDAVLAQQARWMPPQAHSEAGHEWLFLRFYDFSPGGTLTFNVVMLQRDTGGAWQQRVRETPLRPWQHDELADAVTNTGFSAVRCYGDMAGAPFDATGSANLIVVARRGP
jgi:glycine/sarcosine N-methyltransferase